MAGVLALRGLPVTQYPPVAPPALSVSITYPGASAQVIEETAIALIEQELNGVENLLYMESASELGSGSITLTYETGTDLNLASVEAQNRVKRVEARLPEEVRRLGITTNKSARNYVMFVVLISPDNTYDSVGLGSIVSSSVLDSVKRVPGVGEALLFGTEYSMRLWLKPDRLQAYGLSPADVSKAVRGQNTQLAMGELGQLPAAPGQELNAVIVTRSRLASVEEFGNVIIRTNPDGSNLRVKDVARVELGAQDYGRQSRLDGQPSANIAIRLAPGANALETVAAVKARMGELEKTLPKGVQWLVPYDTSKFIDISIKEVLKSLAEALLLVVLVMYVFLGNLRATIIPTIVIPVALVGALVGLYVLGYSINVLTLFAMVLAIGIVVDDAIVVLENTERLMHEHGLNPRAAAIEAMREVTGPVIAIMLVLISVFVPIAFIGGLAGVLYRQFAVTISIAVLISGIVALTLTPALCAVVLRPEHKQVNAFFRGFNRFFGWVTKRYTGGVAWMLKRAVVGVLLFAGMLAMTTQLWRMTPTSLVPEEDQGYYISAVFLPDGASLERTDKVVSQVSDAILSNPANEYTVAFTGMDFLGGSFRNSAATVFASQKHWDERNMPTPALVGEFFGKTAGIKDALALAFNPPAIFGLGNAGGFEVNIQNRGEGGPKKMNEVVQAFITRAAQDKTFAFVQTLWRAQTPQLYVDVDRSRAAALGVNLQEAFNTLSATLGTLYVNDFNKYGRTWQVLLSADAEYRKRPEDIAALHVRGANNQMVPLSAFATVKYSTGPDTLTRFNNLPAVKLMGSAAPGVSSGEALARVDQLMKEVLPPDFSYEWSGASYQERRSGGAPGIALGMAAIMMFLILAALYERWTLPFAVLLALPFGLFGALALVWLRNLAFAILLPGVPIPPLTNDVYFQIGLVTLLGLAAKNAILIVEFAIMKQHEDGMSARDAVLEAARLRFRPILMTSLAFILGVLPLALSHGAGAGAQQSVGTGVMGGMLAATFLAIFFVPLFYKLIARNDKKKEVPDA